MQLEGSTMDSITQNEESKIVYDYVMMLHKNTFKRIVYYFKEIDYLKHTTREKKLKTATNRKETSIRNYCTKI